MSNQEQIEAIETEVMEMLQILQEAHDTISRAMYCPVNVVGVDYRFQRHEQLQNALECVKALLDTDWRYTP